MNETLLISLGIIYTLLMTLPFVLGYFNILSFLNDILNKEFLKAKKRISKDKLLEVIFSEERIKFYVFKRLEDLDRMNFTLNTFYLLLGLIVITIYFASEFNNTFFVLFESFLYVFFGVTITIITYYLVKIWLNIKIVDLIIKLDESELTYLKELDELAKEEEKKKK